MLRIQHCLNSRLTNGGKVVSPTHRPRPTSQKFYGTHPCLVFWDRSSISSTPRAFLPPRPPQQQPLLMTAILASDSDPATASLHLQNHLHSIQTWLLHWRMQTNCHSFSTSPEPPPLASNLAPPLAHAD
jgi:hypothetical protein